MLNSLAAETDALLVRQLAFEGETLLSESCELNPVNDRAWADLSYAISLQGYRNTSNGGELGRKAEFSARQALDVSEEVAEYWVRLGVALDLRGR